ncbi:hypothetical protein [Paraburkholderia silvatlantica]|uniref:PAAR motif-containing protein n=1 Tax=Paraburkholderia silvatlantica TaxID=321895 RepID=A0ABR6FHQ6_9BURK|nr:hypothetical protein [Paraburkholderia silvatlantica]MBB2926963.1 hypothetical protein [Paraburkholderia silvatlantica]PVY37414.1 hypothetical protein C7411_10129 [Paraburkholderia silvatlantica]PXW42376.1 hypothetical protein C7413_10129 [Paraburkholderia silvatlantica]
MRRVFLGIGDEAGDAFITEGLPSVTCANPPPEVNISTLYMKTYCRACKQEGYIAPRGPRHKGTGPNGQQWALSGDVNICGCSPPPVFHAERNMAMIFTAEESTGLMGQRANTTTSSATQRDYDQCFHLSNPRTGQPLRDMPYRIITDDGDEIDGRTDARGYTQRISAYDASSATLHVLEETPPLNPDWDKFL